MVESPRLVATTLAAVLIFAACSGGQEATPSGIATPAGAATPAETPVAATPPAGMVESADKAARLEIAADALPQGVRPGDVRITRIQPERSLVEAQTGKPALGYQLEPDGLRFTKPVTISLKVPVSEGRLPLLVLVSGGSLELLQAKSQVDLAAGTATVTATVTHFSEVYDVLSPFRAAITDPSDKRVGESFEAVAAVSVARPTVRLDSRQGARPGEVVRLTLLPPDWEVRDGMLVSGRGYDTYLYESDLEPDRVRFPAVVEPRSGQVVASAEFRCARPSTGSMRLGYRADLSYFLRVERTRQEGGEPVEPPREIRVTDGLELVSEAFRCLAAPAAQDAAPTPRFSVTPIDATFNQATFSTTYRARYTNNTGGSLVYQWSGPDCGSPLSEPPASVRQESGELTFTWSHPHPPCDPTTEHAHVTIRLQVGNLQYSTTCTYQGAATGVGPPCTTRRGLPRGN